MAVMESWLSDDSIREMLSILYKYCAEGSFDKIERLLRLREGSLTNTRDCYSVVMKWLWECSRTNIKDCYELVMRSQESEESKSKS